MVIGYLTSEIHEKTNRFLNAKRTDTGLLQAVRFAVEGFVVLRTHSFSLDKDDLSALGHVHEVARGHDVLNAIDKIVHL